MSIGAIIHAAATVALWLNDPNSDIGLVAVIRAIRVLEGALAEVKKGLGQA